MKDRFFKQRGLFVLILKYTPDDLNELGGWIDVRKNIAEVVTKCDDPERSKWKSIFNSSSTTTGDENQMPKLAQLTFLEFEKADEKQKDNAFRYFRIFVQEDQDQQAEAWFDAQNPEFKLTNVAPQK